MKCSTVATCVLAIVLSLRFASPCSAQSFSEWAAKHPNAASSQPQPAQAQAVPGPPAKDIAGYAIIPLKGTFGDEISDAVFQQSVDYAIQAGTRYIFLDIDSPGGDVQTAHHIADIMQKTAGQVRYICWVEKAAFSASIWVTFSSDALFMNKESMVGAAVAFSRDDQGNAQVSSKFNSAVAAQIVALAESKGYPAAVIRAMVQEGSEAYAWKTPDGKWHVDNTRPDQGAGELVTLSNGKTILTMTGHECEKIGLAGICTSMADVRRQTGIPNLLKVTVAPEELAVVYGAMRGVYDHRMSSQTLADSVPDDRYTTVIQQRDGSTIVAGRSTVLVAMDPRKAAAIEEKLKQSQFETAVKVVGKSLSLLPPNSDVGTDEVAFEAVIRQQGDGLASRFGKIDAGHGGMDSYAFVFNEPIPGAEIARHDMEEKKFIADVYGAVERQADSLLNDWRSLMRDEFAAMRLPATRGP